MGAGDSDRQITLLHECVIAAAKWPLKSCSCECANEFATADWSQCGHQATFRLRPFGGFRLVPEIIGSTSPWRTLTRIQSSSTSRNYSRHPAKVGRFAQAPLKPGLRLTIRPLPRKILH